MAKEIEIPEGYEARIEGNKVIIEPKESKDERIRKALLHCCDYWEKGQFGGIAEEDVPAIRAYLEKQKETTKEELYTEAGTTEKEDIANTMKMVRAIREKRKEQKVDIDKLRKDLYQSGYNDGYQHGKEDTQKEQKPDTRDADDLQLFGFIYDLLNEIEWKDNWAMSKDECLRRLNDYRPQKPSEWSEEEERLFNIIIDILDKEEHSGHLMRDDLKACVRLLKSIPKIFNLQSKQEWSEEDDFMATTVENSFRLHCGQMTDRLSEQYKKFFEKVKSLRPQPKQEWGEEDEANFTWFDKFFRAESVVANGREIPQDKYLWFKSLRPQPQSVKEKKSYKDGFETARRNVARAFMQYLDEHRVDGKMCLSNGECEDIEMAFSRGDWNKINRYANKYLPHWKPSEEQMGWLESAVKLSTDKPLIHGIIISLYEQLKRL